MGAKTVSIYPQSILARYIYIYIYIYIIKFLYQLLITNDTGNTHETHSDVKFFNVNTVVTHFNAHLRYLRHGLTPGFWLKYTVSLFIRT